MSNKGEVLGKLKKKETKGDDKRSYLLRIFSDNFLKQDQNNTVVYQNKRSGHSEWI